MDRCPDKMYNFVIHLCMYGENREKYNFFTASNGRAVQCM